MTISYKKQMVALIAGQLTSLLLSFMLPIILVRVLSVDEYGYYSQFNVVLSFAIVFFSFGVSSELYYFFPRETAENKSVIVLQSFLMLVLLSLITLLFFQLPFLRRFLISNEFLEKNFYYLALSIFLSIPTVIVSALYVVNHNNLISVLYLPFFTIIKVAIILILYGIYKNVNSIFIAILTGSFLQFVFTVVYTLRVFLKNKGSSIINFEILRKQIKYILPLGLASSLRILSQQLDKLIILIFVTPAAYAIYSVAFYGIPGLNQVYLSISQVYIPRMTEAYSKKDIGNVVNLYKSMVSKTLSYTIPIVMIICLYADKIIPFIFSEKYIESVFYFQLYLVTFIFSALGNGNILKATGNTSRILYSYVFSLIVIIPSTYMLIKYFALNGAILSAVLGSVLPRIFLTFYDMRIVSVQMIDFFPWSEIVKMSIISAIFVIPFIILKYFIQMNIFYVSMCIILYLFFVFICQIKYNVFIISGDDLRKYISRIKLIKT